MQLSLDFGALTSLSPHVTKTLLLNLLGLLHLFLGSQLSLVALSVLVQKLFLELGYFALQDVVIHIESSDLVIILLSHARALLPL